MKNVFGTQEELELFNKEGRMVYKFKSSKGYWYEYTYDENGNELTYKDSTGYWYEYTYDDNGNQLTFKNSSGYWSETTYDDKGNELTYKDSEGVSRGLDIPEYNIQWCNLLRRLGTLKLNNKVW